MRLVAGKHADKGVGFRLDAGNAVHEFCDEGAAIARGAGPIELLAREPVNALLKALDQGRDDVVLGLEELIDRSDRHAGALRDQVGGHAVIADLPQQRARGLQNRFHPGAAARLGRKLAQAAARGGCQFCHGTVVAGR